MELLERKKILNKKIIMLQPDMLYSLSDYHSLYVEDDIISQIYFFSMENDVEYFNTAVPDASVDLLFYRKASGEEGIQYIGPTKNLMQSYVKFEGKTEYFGIRFKPCYPLEFAGATTKELYGTVITDNQDDRIYTKLKECLQYAGNLEQKMRVLKKIVLKYVKFCEDSKCNVTRNVIEYLLSQKNNVPLKILASEMGYTPYYLNKLFSAHTSYTIGKYQSVLRMHSVLNQYELLKMEKEHKPDYPEMAFALGYSDQAHMIREFRSYIGTTPLKFWKEYDKVSFGAQDESYECPFS